METRVGKVLKDSVKPQLISTNLNIFVLLVAAIAHVEFSDCQANNFIDISNEENRTI